MTRIRRTRISRRNLYIHGVAHGIMFGAAIVGTIVGLGDWRGDGAWMLITSACLAGIGLARHFEIKLKERR